MNRKGNCRCTLSPSPISIGSSYSIRLWNSSYNVCFLTLLWLIAIVGVANGANGANGANEANGAYEGNATLKKERKVAIVTLVTTGEYIPGAQVLVESLNRVNATGDRIVLWVSSEEDSRSDLTESHLNELLDAGWDRAISLTKKDATFTPCQVSNEQTNQISKSPEMAGLPRYWGTCSKFAIWALTDYDAVIYLDADSLALHNFDFIFDILLQHSTLPPSATATTTTLAAQGNTDCWEDPPPYNQCPHFYTALLAIRPSANIQQYLHRVASRPGLYLMYGELELLNSVLTTWHHLPRYTLVAQSERARPMLEGSSSLDQDDTDNNNASTNDAKTRRTTTRSSALRIDWSQVKVYDFAGPPATKPWKTYWLQKVSGDKYLHYYLGRVPPESWNAASILHPQWVWNDCYDAVRQKLDAITQASTTTAAATVAVASKQEETSFQTTNEL